MSDERRRKRKEVRLTQQEATWLQKALFALGKAYDAHERLGKFKGEEIEEYAFEIDGREVTVEDIEEALEGRLSALMETVKERRRAMR